MSNRSGSSAEDNLYRTRDEVTILLRAAGERTTECACQIVNEVLPGSEVTTIQEAPFERTLRKMCEIGIDSGKAWTFSLDADVLVSVPRVREFLRCADRLPESVFHIQPYILDKISGVVRLAGIRLFRNATLAQALELIPREGEVERPETEMIRRMEEQGWRTNVVRMVVGLHDYEQYYREIYRKCYVHAKKHTEWIGKVVPFWRENGIEDADFRFALHGMWHGLNSNEPLRLDIRTLPTDIEDLLQQEGLDEKTRLQADAISSADVEQTLANHPAVIEWEQRTLEEIPEELSNTWQLIGLKCNEIGWWRIAPWTLGWSLQQAGLGIKRLASKPIKSGSHYDK